MDYSKLKEAITTITDIASSVPEPFREKCFEILLSHLLAPTPAKTSPAVALTPQEETISETPKTPTASAPLPASIRAFMKKAEITDDELAKAIYFDGDEFHFLVEPSTKTISRGQIEWALLLALRAGVTGNNLAADPEDVRSMCQEKGYYDPTNFWKAFKPPKNKALFAGELKAQGDPRKLTAAGQEELSKVLHYLAG